MDHTASRETIAAMNEIDEPLSPELVLVSPPELAARARLLWPDRPFVQPRPCVSSVSTRLGLGFAAFVAVCITATAGPFLLAVLARAR
jgi:hypothetical protein